MNTNLNISRRDHFAALAMHATLVSDQAVNIEAACQAVGKKPEDLIAIGAYAIADAMEKQASKGKHVGPITR